MLAKEGFVPRNGKPHQQQGLYQLGEAPILRGKKAANPYLNRLS